MRTLLWLDDIRDPHVFDITPYIPEPPDFIVWVKSEKEFEEYIVENGIPEFISFDHDLGEGKSGKDAANFLVDYCINNNQSLPAYGSHSSNPVGKENIIKYLDQAKEYL